MKWWQVGLVSGVVLGIGAYVGLTLVGNQVTRETKDQCYASKVEGIIVAWSEENNECVRHKQPYWLEDRVLFKGE